MFSIYETNCPLLVVLQGMFSFCESIYGQCCPFARIFLIPWYLIGQCERCILPCARELWTFQNLCEIIMVNAALCENILNSLISDWSVWEVYFALCERVMDFFRPLREYYGQCSPLREYFQVGYSFWWFFLLLSNKIDFQLLGSNRRGVIWDLLNEWRDNDSSFGRCATWYGDALILIARPLQSFSHLLYSISALFLGRSLSILLSTFVKSLSFLSHAFLFQGISGKEPRVSITFALDRPSAGMISNNSWLKPTTIIPPLNHFLLYCVQTSLICQSYSTEILHLGGRFFQGRVIGDAWK